MSLFFLSTGTKDWNVDGRLAYGIELDIVECVRMGTGKDMQSLAVVSLDSGSSSPC